MRSEDVLKLTPYQRGPCTLRPMDFRFKIRKPKSVPIPLLQLVQSTLLYVRIRPLPNVFINDCTLFDSKCNNTYISDALKKK